MLETAGKWIKFSRGHYQFDLIVLDINLPGEDGFSICIRLRNGGSTPLIMLTALGEHTDQIRGIELGADDYLVKPFVPRELLARIGAVLRRTAPDAELSEKTEKFIASPVSSWTLPPAACQGRLACG